MADETVRDTTALLALFPDSGTGVISPLDVRDAIVSSGGDLGGMDSSAYDTLYTEAGDDTDWDICTHFDLSLNNQDNLTIDTDNGKITVGTAGIYLVYASGGVYKSTTDEYYVALYINGVSQSGTGAYAKGTLMAGYKHPVCVVGVYSLSADDYLEIKIRGDVSADYTRFYGGEFVVQRLD